MHGAGRVNEKVSLTSDPGKTKLKLKSNLPALWSSISLDTRKILWVLTQK